jgi:uncharacterized protein
MLKLKFKKLLYLAVFIAVPVWAGSYDDFFIAIQRDDAQTISALLKRGFDPNSTDPQGQPALGLALHKQSLRAAEILFEHPSTDVNALNAAGESALMLAALRGDKAWVDRLMARGASIDVPGWSPLHYAAAGPNPSVVAELLARGAAVDAVSPNRTTPLMMAAGYGDEASARLLLSRGADPKLRNDLGLQAVDFARRAGREALAGTLGSLVR